MKNFSLKLSESGNKYFFHLPAYDFGINFFKYSKAALSPNNRNGVNYDNSLINL